jgi:hypothetical protein
VFFHGSIYGFFSRFAPTRPLETLVERRFFPRNRWILLRVGRAAFDQRRTIPSQFLLLKGFDFGGYLRLWRDGRQHLPGIG